MFCSEGIFVLILISTVQSLIHPDNAVNQCYCGVPNESTNRIINGELAEEGEFPWAVRVYGRNTTYNEHNIGCGGTLVSDRHVLTAAHCILEGYDYWAKLGTSYAAYHKNASAINWEDLAEIENTIRHPEYVRWHNDIGILKLRHPIDLSCNPNVKPACLPFNQTAKDLAGKTAIVSGWGRTDTDEAPSDHLLKTKVEFYGENMTCLESCPSCLCSGAKEKTGPCSGDSGGPLILKDPFNNGAATLVGIHLGGGGRVNGKRECWKRDRAFLESDVHYYMSNGWLPDQMGDYNTCPPPPYSTWTP